jgi:hypothetical protein
MYKLIDLIRASWFDFMKIYNKNYIETNDIFFLILSTRWYRGWNGKHWRCTVNTTGKVRRIFECEGVLYSIATSTLTGDSNLEDGRNILSSSKITCFLW